ncbi:MAG: IS66 family transposase [Pyrinomonadaceae bacterium]|nr:IS66 family transposase [Pyrinomonadaceae bacterium]
MLTGFNILKSEWIATPKSIRDAATLVQHQLRLLQIRFTAYQKKIAALEAQVAELESLKIENAALRERLGQNSQNSSKPPSSDAPQHRRTYHHESSNKKQGAQTGHVGHGRKLKPFEEVDHLVDLRPISCEQCGRRLRGNDPRPYRHQVTEIPPAQAEVTEYRRHTLSCQRCGTLTEAEWSEEMPRGSFGPRLQAIVAYLTGRLGLSHRDVVEALSALYRIEISLGSVSALQRQVSKALATPVKTAQGYVQRQAINYVDETGWKVKGKGRWLWLNATKGVTVFQLLKSRNQIAAREVIGNGKIGIITTDRYPGYSWLSNERRQLCWAHLKRDFQAIAERGGESQEIGEAFVAQAKELFRLWHQVRNGTIARRNFQRLIMPVQHRIKELLERGSECQQRKTRGTCRQLRMLEAALWTFVRVLGVEPTNNHAERVLRRAVLWRRKSFGTQSEAGSRYVERILTTIMSLRQQGRDVLEYLSTVCAPTTGAGDSTCLLPDFS